MWAAGTMHQFAYVSGGCGLCTFPIQEFQISTFSKKCGDNQLRITKQRLVQVFSENAGKKRRNECVWNVPLVHFYLLAKTLQTHPVKYIWTSVSLFNWILFGSVRIHYFNINVSIHVLPFSRWKYWTLPIVCNFLRFIHRKLWFEKTNI